MTIDPQPAAFLTAHQQGVLATSKQDGSPQQSSVLYHFDGDDLVVSAKSYTAKWHNAVRQPKVCLAVTEGHEQAIVYGTAEGFDTDPERRELSRRLFAIMMPDVELSDEELEGQLDEQQRTVLRIIPDKVLYNE